MKNRFTIDDSDILKFNQKHGSGVDSGNPDVTHAHVRAKTLKRLESVL